MLGSSSSSVGGWPTAVMHYLPQTSGLEREPGWVEFSCLYPASTQLLRHISLRCHSVSVSLPASQDNVNMPDCFLWRTHTLASNVRTGVFNHTQAFIFQSKYVNNIFLQTGLQSFVENMIRDTSVKKLNH